MKASFSILLLLILLAAAGLTLSSAYVVTEGQQAVVTQFGRPVSFQTDAGLHWKVPFVQDVETFEKRLLPWDGDPENMQTLDKKRIFIDVWARWRIADLETFYTAVRFEQKAHRKLDDLVNSAVRDVIANRNLIEVVRTTNDELVYESEELKNVVRSRETDVEQVRIGRDQMEREMFESASASLRENFGIELAGRRVHIKRVNYVQSVKETVYERMRSERIRIAKLFESQGEEEKKRIEGAMQEELLQIEGETQQQTETIRGEADAEVIRLTAEAYGASPEFYEFVRRMELFQETLGDKTHLVLSTDNELLKLFTTRPDAAGAGTPADAAGTQKKSSDENSDK